MGRIATRLHLFIAANIVSVQAQTPGVCFIWFRTKNHYMIQGSFQQIDIVCIGSGKTTARGHCGWDMVTGLRDGDPLSLQLPPGQPVQGELEGDSGRSGRGAPYAMT